jgi:hypothetical protein
MYLLVVLQGTDQKMGNGPRGLSPVLIASKILFDNWCRRRAIAARIDRVAAPPLQRQETGRTKTIVLMCAA